jgi:hypothetical protein
MHMVILVIHLTMGMPHHQELILMNIINTLPEDRCHISPLTLLAPDPDILVHMIAMSGHRRATRTAPMKQVEVCLGHRNDREKNLLKGGERGRSGASEMKGGGGRHSLTGPAANVSGGSESFAQGRT